MSVTEIKARREYAAPALERAFDVFELLADRGEGLTISQIASALGRSISEVFRIILVMERRGWLVRIDGADRYQTSPWMLDVAYRGTLAQSLASVAAPVMRELATAINQSCHLVIRAGTRGLVIHRQENAGPSGFSMRVGAVIDLVSSCSGHVLMAFEPEVSREDVLATFDDATRAALRRLEPRLAQVRTNGLERQPSARAAGVTDISVPIFGFNRIVAAALTVPYLAMIGDFSAATLDETQNRLIEAGRAISELMGSRTRPEPV